jgi:hypothetical protein
VAGIVRLADGCDCEYVKRLPSACRHEIDFFCSFIVAVSSQDTKLNGPTFSAALPSLRLEALRIKQRGVIGASSNGTDTATVQTQTPSSPHAANKHFLVTTCNSNVSERRAGADGEGAAALGALF